MQSLGIFCAIVATASAGYASSASGGAGLYNTNSYDGGNYGPKYPYSNQYTGFAGAGAGAYPFAPAAPFASPYDFQQAFQQYYNQLSAFNANLYSQQLAHQAAVFDSIRNQAYGGGGYGGGYGAGAGGYGAGAGGYGGAGGFNGASAGGFNGASAGASGFGGATASRFGESTGSYGGVGPSGGSFGGTYGGNGQAPNYASAGGAVGPGFQQQHASIYPANPARPNLDSRFGGDDSPVGVSHSQGQPGFVGVSSFSSSSDVNGQRHRESATSVNNNGKVTTYQTRT